MAAEGLQQAAKALGHDLRVETQGSVGARDELTAEEIAAADLVVLAADREVDRARFGGKRVFSSGTKVAINDGKALLARALAEAEVQPGGARPSTSGAAGAPTQKRERTGPYKHLMTGVSFMLPFIVAGGLMIALAFAIGGIYADKAEGTVGHTLYQIGDKGAFTLIVPALAGYIAFSIADRPGIAPGMVGGVLAANLGAGFLGGIVAGFIAGYGTSFLGRVIRLPKNLDGLKPVLILPVLGTLLTGLCMIYAVGAPAARLLVFLTSWLEGLQGSSAILLGLLLGGMMAVDMGGPINKAAYTFSTGLIASHVYTPMAAVMVAGMAPPLALALATRVFANRFTHDEREAGGAAAVLGLAFITEGAIPFAARDPFRVLPALVCGSSVAGAIAMSAGVELRVPHGGAFVLPIPGAVTHLASCVLALVAGIVVSTALLGVLKKKLDVTEG
jgi:PTS system fructose-specific IIC component